MSDEHHCFCQMLSKIISFSYLIQIVGVKLKQKNKMARDIRSIWKSCHQKTSICYLKFNDERMFTKVEMLKGLMSVKNSFFRFRTVAMHINSKPKLIHAKHFPCQFFVELAWFISPLYLVVSFPEWKNINYARFLPNYFLRKPCKL